jgi:hypothetical protein
MKDNAKNSGERDWRITEKIAGILEKFITPDSTVEHNKFLPVIGRPERKKRQCDVVITFGSGIRKSIIIVEVQKRKSKPGITTFHGWVEKMREVGAQQLICVSELGFPQSIIDEVEKKYGNNTIALMTLKEFDYMDSPHKIKLAPYIIHFTPQLNILSCSTLILQKNKNEKSANQTELPDINSAIFSINDDNKRYNFTELVMALFNNNEEYSKIIELAQRETIEVELEIVESSNVSIFINEEKTKVKSWIITIQVQMQQEVRDAKMKQYTYSQELINGTIAWIASYSFPINGIEQKIDIVFNTKGGKGSIMIRE